MYDPLRKIEVPGTPEEEVRQWFIAQLRDVFGVPCHRMMSEVGFEFGRKHFRCDILVYDVDGSPLMLVECKRPSVTIDSEVARQALKYNSVLDVRYITLTNGNTVYIYGKGPDGVFSPLSSFPEI